MVCHLCTTIIHYNTIIYYSAKYYLLNYNNTTKFIKIVIEFNLTWIFRKIKDILGMSLITDTHYR